MIEFAYILLRGIRTTFFGFKHHITDTNDRLSYNSQYPNLQRLLNDKYDNSSRRIKVYDGTENENFLFAYPNEELKPIEIGFVVVKPMLEYTSYEGFIVELPTDFEQNNDLINSIKQIVNNYKFSGTYYTINFK
jgi:hypothetical protein